MFKVTLNTDIVQNLLVAQTMIQDMPASAFNLDIYANDKLLDSDGHNCGSVGCFGGWIAHHPHFKKQGVSPDPDTGAPYMKKCYLWGQELSYQLFGDATMFYGRSKEHLNEKRTRKMKS